MSSKYVFTIRPKRALVTRTPAELLATHDSLHRLVQKCGLHEPTPLEHSVAIDLSEASDIDPGAVLLMMYTGWILLLRGWSLYVTGSGKGFRKVSRNIQHLRLTAKDRPLFERDPGDYPLRRVEHKDNMVSELENWAETVKKDTQAKEEQVAVWSMQIGEVVTNSFQHGPEDQNPSSMQPNVFLCGGLQENHVQLAALDTGRGIPASIREAVTEEVRQEGDAALIREACKLGITSRSTRWNQGYGLPHLVDLVKENGGTVQIFSHRGLVHLRGKKMHKRNLEKSERRLNGTLTIVSLRVV
jgi:hypothetical protein